MTRDEHQNRAVIILESQKRLICQWATGAGKTMVALKFIKKHPGRTLVFVPESNNIENWEAEFDKFGVSMDSVTIACYASIHKFENTSWNFVVFDEAPHVDTFRRKHFCNSINANYVLALGAKVDDEEKQSLLSVYGYFAEYNIGLTDAIEQGLIVAPTVYIVHTKLDKIKYKHIYRGQTLNAEAYYDILNAKVDKAKEEYENSPSKATHDSLMFAGARRKQFLGKIKEDIIKYLCSNLEQKNRRFICFCSSVKQAERIGKGNAFTSKTPKSMKVLDKFNNKEINSIFVVGKLIEGQNLVGIERGVIGQLSGTERITIQSIGRIIRSANPVIYIPVIDDTKDEDFLRNVTDNIPNEYIKHYNF